MRRGTQRTKRTDTLFPYTTLCRVAAAEQDQPAPEAADGPVDPHAGHDMAPATPQAEPMDHAAMGHGTAMDQDLPATAPPLDPIPPVTPGDRAAAFPDVDGHAVHDTAIH